MFRRVNNPHLFLALVLFFVAIVAAFVGFRDLAVPGEEAAETVFVVAVIGFFVALFLGVTRADQESRERGERLPGKARGEPTDPR